MEFSLDDQSVQLLLALLMGLLIVLLFALPVATKRWVWLWFIVILMAIGLAANAYLTFTDFWPDRHGFLRMWAAILIWPFVVGFIVRGLNAVLERFTVRGFQILFWTVTSLGLLVAVAPYGLLFLST
jgi:hypothetical protein